MSVFTSSYDIQVQGLTRFEEHKADTHNSNCNSNGNNDSGIPRTAQQLNVEDLGESFGVLSSVPPQVRY